MDDFQQYNQALQEAQQDARNFGDQAKSALETTRQQIEQTLGETFGTEVIRETLSKAVGGVKNLALKRLGFTDDEIQTLEEQGFKKGLTQIAKSRISSKISSAVDDDAVKTALRNRGVSEDALDVLKDTDKYKEAFKKQFPDSELNDAEIETRRIRNLKRLDNEGQKLKKQQQPEETQADSPAPDAPTPAPAPDAPTVPDAPTSTAPDVPDVPDPSLPFGGGPPPGGVLQPGARQLGARDLTQQAAQADQQAQQAAQQAQQTSQQAQLRQASSDRQFQQSRTAEDDPEDLDRPQSGQDLAERSTDPLQSEVNIPQQDIEKTAAQQTEKSLAKDTTETLTEDAGEEGVSGLLTGLGTAADFLGPVGLVAGIGLLISSLFVHKKEHTNAAPVPTNETNPSAQFGLHP